VNPRGHDEGVAGGKWKGDVLLVSSNVRRGALKGRGYGRGPCVAGQLQREEGGLERKGIWQGAKGMFQCGLDGWQALKRAASHDMMQPGIDTHWI
jgi:hypothetical protein